MKRIEILFFLLPLLIVSLNAQEKIEIEGAIILSNSEGTSTKGTIRWNDSTSDFEGFNGDVWVSLTKNNGGWGKEQSIVKDHQKKHDPFGIDEDQMGRSVAISGDYAIVGSTHFGGIGSAIIFHKDENNQWVFQQKLMASDGASGDEFGISVGISGDYAIVGANGDDDNGSSSGSAYIYHRSGTNWGEEKKLIPSVPGLGFQFGRSVAISGDDAIVGEFQGNSVKGAAYIFRRSGTSWPEQIRLIADIGDSGSYFGYSVGISNGNAIIGAPFTEVNGIIQGSAYIFTRLNLAPGSPAWMQVAQLTASDGEGNDVFGWSTAISGGNVIVGAYNDKINGICSGSAYIFRFSLLSGWGGEKKINAADGSDNDHFGRRVNISGNHVVIGAYGDDDLGTTSGSAYVFQKSGSTWMEQTKFMASDGTTDNRFGSSVAISSDFAIIGSINSRVNTINPGAVYFFEKN